MSQLATVIRYQREKLGLTQQQAADKAGIVVSTWSRLERDTPHTPSRRTLQRIADTLQINLDSFLPATPPPRSPTLQQRIEQLEQTVERLETQLQFAVKASDLEEISDAVLSLTAASLQAADRAKNTQNV